MNTEVINNHQKPPFGKQMLADGRLTTKKLIKWLNEQFIKFEITQYEVTDISRTYFTSNDYECGACRLIIHFKHKATEHTAIHNNGYFYCFYRIKELENYMKEGYELYLQDKGKFGLLTDLEIEVRKPFL